MLTAAYINCFQIRTAFHCFASLYSFCASQYDMKYDTHETIKILSILLCTFLFLSSLVDFPSRGIKGDKGERGPRVSNCVFMFKSSM